jgi:hypothetical protein
MLRQVSVPRAQSSTARFAATRWRGCRRWNSTLRFTGSGAPILRQSKARRRARTRPARRPPRPVLPPLRRLPDGRRALWGNVAQRILLRCPPSPSLRSLGFLTRRKRGDATRAARWPTRRSLSALPSAFRWSPAPRLSRPRDPKNVRCDPSFGYARPLGRFCAGETCELEPWMRVRDSPPEMGREQWEHRMPKGARTSSASPASRAQAPSK